MSTTAVKILVVDDEPPIRKLLRVGLTAEGYAMVEAGNAEQAIALVASEKPDLILLKRASSGRLYWAPTITSPNPLACVNWRRASASL
jgi:PleD family two-component response regulator